jgi:predicted nucleic acid-binding protein
VIAVDTSVWIDHLNNVRTAHVERLRVLIDDDNETIVVGDLVLCEVLQGLASEREAATVARVLRQFDVQRMGGEDIAIQAAANYRTLRALGITVRRTIDMLIGTFCIENGMPLLHADRDFGHMERHLGLAIVAM